MNQQSNGSELQRIKNYFENVLRIEDEFYNEDIVRPYMVYVDCCNELLEDRGYNGLVALVAKLVSLYCDDRIIPKKYLYDAYRGLTNSTKDTIEKRIVSTIEAVGWTIEVRGTDEYIDTNIVQVVDENGKKKPRGYIKLTPLEAEQLLKTKDSTAIKTYLRISQLNSGYVNDREKIYLRKVTITGENGLAKSLGYSTSNSRSIKKALEKLQDNYLIAYTGNQYNENNRGKYILINALLGDSEKRWVSYNLNVYNSNTIFSKIVQPRVLTATTYDVESSDMVGAYYRN